MDCIVHRSRKTSDTTERLPLSLYFSQLKDSRFWGFFLEFSFFLFVFVFLSFSFFYDPMDVGNLISGYSA